MSLNGIPIHIYMIELEKEKWKQQALHNTHVALFGMANLTSMFAEVTEYQSIITLTANQFTVTNSLTLFIYS